MKSKQTNMSKTPYILSFFLGAVALLVGADLAFAQVAPCGTYSATYGYTSCPTFGSYAPGYSGNAGTVGSSPSAYPSNSNYGSYNPTNSNPGYTSASGYDTNFGYSSPMNYPTNGGGININYGNSSANNTNSNTCQNSGMGAGYYYDPQTGTYAWHAAQGQQCQNGNVTSGSAGSNMPWSTGYNVPAPSYAPVNYGGYNTQYPYGYSGYGYTPNQDVNDVLSWVQAIGAVSNLFGGNSGGYGGGYDSYGGYGGGYSLGGGYDGDYSLGSYGYDSGYSGGSWFPTYDTTTTNTTYDYTIPYGGGYSSGGYDSGYSGGNYGYNYDDYMGAGTSWGDYGAGGYSSGGGNWGYDKNDYFGSDQDF